MHPPSVRREALLLLDAEHSLSEVSRRTGVSRSTSRSWRDGAGAGAASCPRCHGRSLEARAYSALLGFYLGDGHVSAARRCHTLRVSCDASLPGIVEDVVALCRRVHPRRPVHLVRAPGTIVVSQHWKLWPCLFPQHGPGRKHERPIVLEPWQRALVEAEPAAFLRGLFHSDGSRVRNWATRTVDGRQRRLDYARWQFVNHSADVRDLGTWALDLVVPVARILLAASSWWPISVSRRAGVARLDTLIGPEE
ncbi:transcriptional regulator [Nocardioides zeae]|uniref:Transcriptional regulator n=1 Tax=Nocardioides imazamoxiresistens TaxID=3231893 RepID=A0ABU3PZ58_9ACTN|nr:transcriptional regulator [Nocardioides zeae]MDT9594542.1 transcriptional regulator [Nocardioides zeae]